ncbi:hypothetical protein HK102_001516 [Quaeritorhiza haematococci]|nr:hypothetical protein HK102_001516 [Quaeritorhiza haematococci]
MSGKRWWWVGQPAKPTTPALASSESVSHAFDQTHPSPNVNSVAILVAEPAAASSTLGPTDQNGTTTTPPSKTLVEKALSQPSLYPFKGILFCMRHPRQLLGRMIGLMLLTVIVCMAVFGLLVGFALVPQKEAFSKVNVPEGLAWVLAIFLIIFEAALFVIFWVLFFIPFTVDSLFEQVLYLKLKDVPSATLLQSNPYRAGQLNHTYTRLRTFIIHIRLRLSFQKTLRAFLATITLPLNAIPFLGTAAFSGLNAFMTGWNHHLHYLALNGIIDMKEGRRFCKSRAHEYVSYGVVATFLEMLPVLNVLFVFTNVVGAALWAADMEMAGRSPRGWKAEQDRRINGQQRSQLEHTT